MEYEIVMGLEVHVELSTKTKIFCGCSTEFGGEPNSHTCPVCMGMPGSLPVLNKGVVDRAIKAGIAFHSDLQYTNVRIIFIRICRRIIRYHNSTILYA